MPPPPKKKKKKFIVKMKKSAQIKQISNTEPCCLLSYFIGQKWILLIKDP